MNESHKVNVLFVDDQEAPFRELKHSLMESDPSIEFELVWASSVAEYHKCIRELPSEYDVLIADLKLASGQEDLRQGIEEVVSWHLIHSPSTIVIIYSVFTSDAPDAVAEAIDTCVLALRAGAADCIKKGIGSTKRLANAILRELQMRRDPTLTFDSNWWAKHKDDLMNEYAGSAIAVLGESVILSAETIPDLRKKLKTLDRSEFDPNLLPRIILLPDFEE